MRPIVGSRLLAASLLSLACFALAGCMNIAQTRTHGHLISATMIQQVPVGASQDQVLLVLGTPSTTSAVPEAGDSFYYISQKTQTAAAFLTPRVIDQRVVAVYFDKTKRVTKLADYGLKDGVVFDFVARKTPSGGRDVNFIGQLLQGMASPSL